MLFYNPHKYHLVVNQILFLGNSHITNVTGNKTSYSDMACEYDFLINKKTFMQKYNCEFTNNLVKESIEQPNYRDTQKKNV